jgi:flagellar basal body rod protein FlgB
MNDSVSSLIIRQMDISAARHRVLAHNLANSGTPGAVQKGAAFEAALGAAKAGKAAGGGNSGTAGGPAAQEAGTPDAAQSESLQGAAAGQASTVEGLEMQMARLADNTGRFSALARILTIRERAYENAIRGR